MTRGATKYLKRAFGAQGELFSIGATEKGSLLVLINRATIGSLPCPLINREFQFNGILVGHGLGLETAPLFGKGS